MSHTVHTVRPLPDRLASRLPAAAEVFAAAGIEDARIEDVAAATGIPKATLYYYFSGKEEVLAWLLEQILDSITREVERAIAAEGTAADRLRAVIRAQFATLAEHPATCRILLSETRRVDRLPEVSAALREAFHGPVERLLAEGARDGSLRSVDVETAAAATFGAISGVGTHYLLAEVELDPERWASDVEAIVLEGLRAPD